jgi:hypothetical protein
MNIISKLYKSFTLYKQDKEQKRSIANINSTVIADIENWITTTSGVDLNKNEINTIMNDPVVVAKRNIRLNKAKSYQKALSYVDKKDVNEFVDQFLVKTFPFEDFDKYVELSKPYGYSVIRLIWDKDNLIGCEHLDYDNFYPNANPSDGAIGDIMFNTYNISRDYQYNFIIVNNEKCSMYPAGQSELRQLKDAIKFKLFLNKVKAAYYNKSVIPAFVAIYETTETDITKLQEQADLFSEILTGIENGSGVALPNMKSVQVLQPNGQVNFERTEERLDKIISVRLLGSDLTDSTRNGTQAQATVGAEYIEGNIKELGTTIQQARNKIIRKAVDVKFGISEQAPEYIYNFSEPYSKEIFESQANLTGYTSSYEFYRVYPKPKGFIDPADDMLKFKDILQQKADQAKQVEDDKEDNQTPDKE